MELDDPAVLDVDEPDVDDEPDEPPDVDAVESLLFFEPEPEPESEDDVSPDPLGVAAGVDPVAEPEAVVRLSVR